MTDVAKKDHKQEGKDELGKQSETEADLLDSFHSLKEIEMTSSSESEGTVAEKADWGWRSWWGTNKYQPFKWHVHLTRKVYQHMAGGLAVALTLSWELSWGGGAEAGGRGASLRAKNWICW